MHRRIIISSIIAALVTALPVIGKEEPLKFDCFTVEDGLKTNTVLCLHQDSSGMMWFGTNDGLTRYDTYGFKTFRKEAQDPSSIGNNSVYCIFEDKNGKLWIGTEKGLYQHDRDSEKFNKPQGFPTADNLHVRSITQDRQGNIWIASLGNGVFRYNPSTFQVSNYRNNPEQKSGLTSDYVSKIIADGKGNIWCISSGNALHRFDDESGQFIAIKIKDSEKGVEEKNAFSMCMDYTGNLWIAGWDSGLFHYDTANGNFRNYLTDGKGRSLIKGRIHIIRESEPGKIMIGSDHGIHIFNVESKELQHISYDSMSERSLSDNFVYDFLTDKEGGLWVATYFGGVNYANPNSRLFSYRKCNGTENKGRVISKFCENADKSLWIGTDDGGLFRYYPHTDRCVQVELDPTIPNLNIHALLDDGEILWIGTYSHGLYRLNCKSGKLEHFLNFGCSEKEPQSIYALYKEQNGTMWIGTKTGIHTWTAEKGFSCAMHLGVNSDITKICPDSKGNLWFVSISKGLMCYDRQMQSFKKISETIETLPDEITSMCIYHDTIWLGTSGRGLIKYDTTNGKVAAVETPYTNMTIYSIINYGEEMWMTTSEGLMRYNMSTGKTGMFSREDGLSTDVFTYNSGLRTSDGRIWIGTNDGFNYFNPADIQSNLTAPQTHIHNIGDNECIQLHKGHAPFTIRFASLSYRSPQRNRYRYMLEGFDEEIHECEYDQNQITYSNLPCGEYVFRISSSNNDGIWGESSQLKIIVSPYWYNSTAAIIIYSTLAGCLLIGIAIAFYTWRLQKKKARAEKIKHVKEKTRIETELQFFTNLAHEIRTPVMLINAPVNEILSTPGISAKVKENAELIRKSSDKLSALTTEILNFRKCSADMVMTPQPISRLTRQIAEEFSTMAATHDIVLTFVDDTDGKTIVSVNAEAWNKILNNLITNAIKFTRDKIEIRISSRNNNLTVSVRDNGTGISEEERKKIFQAFWRYDKMAQRQIPGFGLGLSITSMLVHKMGMSIGVESEPQRGSCFTVSIAICDNEVTVNESIIITPPHAEEKRVESQEEVVPHAIDKKQKQHTTIMIVDDDDDLRKYIEHILSEDFNTISVADGSDALEMLKNGTPVDILICDVMMPKIGGIELCGILRKDINLCHIPVILLSGNSDEEIKAKALQSGSNVYISKPVEPSYLILQINNLIENRQALWDSFSKRPFISLSGIADKSLKDTFIKQFSDIVLKNMSNPELSVDGIAEEMHTSRSVLYQKVKELSGMTPNNFIKVMRLRKAAQLLMQENYKINEICWLVGFNTPSYFSKCFFEEFGVHPKDFSSYSTTTSKIPTEE